jgi:HAD superfamily hydrolase (TIGR01509 family)
MEFLDWARTEHKHVSLVTSSNRRIQTHITNAFGISTLFDTIVTGNDIREGKPSPEPYLTALGRLSLRGTKSSVVIEGSKSGVLSGLTAGCDVLAITTSHTHAELQTVNPTFIAATYALARLMLQTG